MPEKGHGLLAGKVAVVSGIGPGIGRDISLRFADEGADVVLAARTPSKLEAVAKEVEERGRRALCVRLDMTDADGCVELVEQATAEFGGIDVLVNNAFHMGDFTKVMDA